MEYTDLGSRRQCNLCQSTKVNRRVHFYYQAFLPYRGEQASRKPVHQLCGSGSQKKPCGLAFHPCAHSQQQSGDQLQLNKAERLEAWPDADQPWRHLELLPMNIITAATNGSRTLNKTKQNNKNQLSWVKIWRKKTVLQRIYKAQLSLPASFFCNKAKHEVPSSLVHPAADICAHLVPSRKYAWAHDIFTSLHSHFLSFFAGPSGWASGRFYERS